MSRSTENLGSTEPPGDVTPARQAAAWPWLLAITAVGGLLRFWRLGYQSYWVDEAYSVARVRGSFDFMLQQLMKQGFPPGWYALLRGWCLGVERLTGDGAWAFSPGATRMLPAALGTLTIPAMYFMARQFACRRMSLLVALLAAVNPFLIYYSRDIKMYGALALFATLHLALFFKWLAARKAWPWLPLWILAGAVMVAMQSVAWLLLPLELLAVLTRRGFRWRDPPLWLAGVAAMAAFPLFWFFHFVQPNLWLRRVAGTQSAGSEWYTSYTHMSAQTLLGVPTSHLLGFLWPVYPPDRQLTQWFELGRDFGDHLDTRSWAWLAAGEWYAGVALIVVLLAGLFPWRRWLRSRAAGQVPPPAQARPFWRAWWFAVWLVFPTLVLALTWIPRQSPWFGWVWHNWDVKPFWEPRYLIILVPAWLIWLAAAIVRLPARPVRWVVAAGVILASLYSASSNYLVYRNAPYLKAAEIAERYIDHANRKSAVMAVPDGFWPYPAMDGNFTVARRVRPGSPEDARWTAAADEMVPAGAVPLWSIVPADPAYLPRWARQMVSRRDLTTLVLTDQLGDVEGELSDERMSALLGPRWKLVYEEKYRLYFEWRFYIFHTWRTRVWVADAKTSAAPAAAPSGGSILSRLGLTTRPGATQPAPGAPRTAPVPPSPPP